MVIELTRPSGRPVRISHTRITGVKSLGDATGVMLENLTILVRENPAAVNEMRDVAERQMDMFDHHAGNNLRAIE